MDDSTIISNNTTVVLFNTWQKGIRKASTRKIPTNQTPSPPQKTPTQKIPTHVFKYPHPGFFFSIITVIIDIT